MEMYDLDINHPLGREFKSGLLVCLLCLLKIDKPHSGQLWSQDISKTPVF